MDAAGCTSNFTACSGFSIPTSTLLSASDGCTGTADPPATPVCYQGHAKALGVVESVSVKAARCRFHGLPIPP